MVPRHVHAAYWLLDGRYLPPLPRRAAVISSLPTWYIVHCTILSTTDYAGIGERGGISRERFFTLAKQSIISSLGECFVTCMCES